MLQCRRASTLPVGIAIVCLTLAGCATSPPAVQTPPPGVQVAELPQPAHPFECKGRMEYQGVKDGFYVFACPNRSYYFDTTYNFTKAVDADGTVGGDYKPHFPGHSFPLWVGKEWRERFDGRAVNDRWSSDVRAKVAALEDVEVAAGRLQAYRIEFEDYWRSGGNSGVSQYTHWYAPDVKRTVKSLNPQNAKWNFELAKFHME